MADKGPLTNPAAPERSLAPQQRQSQIVLANLVSKNDSRRYI
jgi:hypothetical protein